MSSPELHVIFLKLQVSVISWQLPLPTKTAKYFNACEAMYHNKYFNCASVFFLYFLSLFNSSSYIEKKMIKNRNTVERKIYITVLVEISLENPS